MDTSVEYERSIMQKVLSEPQKYNFEIDSLGDCNIQSPLQCCCFTERGTRTSITTNLQLLSDYAAKGEPIPSFEKAGPADRDGPCG